MKDRARHKKKAEDKCNQASTQEKSEDKCNQASAKEEEDSCKEEASEGCNCSWSKSGEKPQQLARRGLDDVFCCAFAGLSDLKCYLWLLLVQANQHVLCKWPDVFGNYATRMVSSVWMLSTMFENYGCGPMEGFHFYFWNDENACSGNYVPYVHYMFPSLFLECSMCAWHVTACSGNYAPNVHCMYWSWFINKLNKMREWQTQVLHFR